MSGNGGVRKYQHLISSLHQGLFPQGGVDEGLPSQHHHLTPARMGKARDKRPHFSTSLTCNALA